ncbi:hypothetical protein D5085_04985 [Ectothiorhodospiraceae bacterium BW-2]|nr:hypothetical protein D5085_04985 [Ectothiorhodospiraceae bacterium BW-2]
MSRARGGWVFGLWCGVMAFPLLAQQELRITTGVDYPFIDSATGEPGFLAQVLTEALQPLGYRLKVVQSPPARALQNANQGIDDGDLLRIAGLEQSYPNLVQVPESLFDTDFVGYTLHGELSGEGWQRLKGLRVTYVVGWKIFEQQIDESMRAEPVRSAPQMFKLLQAGVVDVALYEKWQGLYQARLSNLDRLQVVEPPFATVSQYSYLHQKHAHLIEPLARALRELKSRGRYRQLYEQILLPHRPPVRSQNH